MILLTATQTLELLLAAAPATTQPTYVTDWVDENTTTFALGAVGSADGLTTSTSAVTAVASPSSGSVRRVTGLSLYNTDTVSVIATVQLNDNGTVRTIWKGLVQDGDALLYDDQRGFYLITSSGELRVAITNIGTASSSSSAIAAHATTHESGGTDAIPLDTLATPSDVTTLNASTSRHGLLPKLDGTASHYFKGDGSQGAIASGDVPTLNQNTTGSAAKLTTARTIAGVSFDGTANITIASSNLSDGTNVALDNAANNFSVQQVLQKGIAIKGVVTATALSSGSNNDWAPGALTGIFLLRLTGDGVGLAVLTGMAGGAVGELISLVNVGPDVITVTDNDSNSAAGNRFRLGANVSLTTWTTLLLIYDPAISQWVRAGGK